MRFRIQILCVLFISTLGVVDLKAGDLCGSITNNLVQNCGFETDSFAGWTLSGNLQGGEQGNYYGVNSGFQNSGNYSAYFGIQGGGGTDIGSLGPFLDLSQAISVASNEYYRFTFYLEDDAAPAIGYQQYFATYLNGVQLNLIQNPTDSALIGTYEAFSYIVNPALPSGQANLSFLFQNDNSFWFLDDVSVVPAGPTPEPASFLLVLPALGAMYLLRRSRRS